MTNKPELRHPRLVAVWPGMGHVGVNAGIYLLAKLEMTAFAEFDSATLFDTDAVEVKEGIIRPARRPRHRLFLWSDPDGQNDLLVFLGEAQPPLGKAAFCRDLVRYVKELGVDRVYTFAAMATQMHPEHPSRVYAAATDDERLAELKELDVTVLEDGQIGGLNGVLLGVAAEEGLSGACLLGEMPHIFSQLPFPKASLAVLEQFTALTGVEVDTTELAEQADAVEKQLGELLARVEDQLQKREEPEQDEEFTPEPDEEQDPEVTRRIEQLFEQAAGDRSKAFELKRELDRMGVFREYEDRFLDLFRKRQ